MDKKKKIQAVICVIAVLICGVIYLTMNNAGNPGGVVTEHFTGETGQDGVTAQPDPADSPGPSPDISRADPSGQDWVYVHICGEVKRPGVYTFPDAPRLIEVVESAGGFTKKADRAAVNQAEAVLDGSQIMIPSKHSARLNKKNHDMEETQPTSDGRVNINTASREELMTLNGIGESKASQIIAYRETNGAFKKIEDIMNISGIKEGVFSKIKENIIV